MTKVLITGVAGLIGSRLAYWILNNVPGAKVVGIDDLSGGYRDNIPLGIRFEKMKLGTGSKMAGVWLNRIFRQFQPDYVFHFAAFAAEGLSPFVRCYTIQNTWLATAEIVNACLARPPKRLVFTSSMAVYGRQTPPFDESMPRVPIDPYGIGKAACEADIEIAREQHGLDYCLIRPHNVYGDHQNLWNDYRNVLGIWMRQHLEGKPLRVYGDGSQTRAFSYIDDSLPCLWRAATEPQAANQVINLGGTRPVTILEAARTLSNVMGGAEIIHTPPRHEVHEAWSTWQKSVDLLGFEDKTPLAYGLATMWDWAKRTWDRYPDRRNPPPMEYEVNEGLYPWWQNIAVQRHRGADNDRINNTVGVTSG